MASYTFFAGNKLGTHVASSFLICKVLKSSSGVFFLQMFVLIVNLEEPNHGQSRREVGYCCCLPMGLMYGERKDIVSLNIASPGKVSAGCLL